MEQPPFNELFKKYLDNTCSPEEADRLLALLEQEDLTREDLLRGHLLSDPEPAGYSDPLLQERLEQRLSHIIQHINTPPVRKGLLRRPGFGRMAAAAAILLLLAAGTYYWLNRPVSPGPLAHLHPPMQNDVRPGSDRAVLTLADGKQLLLDSTANGLLAQQGNATVHKQEGQLVYDASHSQLTTHNSLVYYNTMTTPRGGQYRLTLPDGTGVWLNAASSIRYPTAFIGPERKVYVTGEAYFEVKTILREDGREKLPFIVNVSTASGQGEDVEVLGTHFNINAYDDEPVIATTLLEGKVKVTGHTSTATGSGHAQGQPAMLSPGQQAVIAREPGKPLTIQVQIGTDIEQVMAWKNHLFKFDNADLKKVMRQLARWYDVEVSYEKNAPLSEVFLGEMQTSLNLSQVLKGLGGMGVHFRIEGRKLVVMP